MFDIASSFVGLIVLASEHQDALGRTSSSSSSSSWSLLRRLYPASRGDEPYAASTSTPPPHGSTKESPDDLPLSMTSSSSGPEDFEMADDEWRDECCRRESSDRDYRRLEESRWRALHACAYDKNTGENDVRFIPALASEIMTDDARELDCRSQTTRCKDEIASWLRVYMETCACRERDFWGSKAQKAYDSCHELPVCAANEEYRGGGACYCGLDFDVNAQFCKNGQTCEKKDRRGSLRGPGGRADPFAECSDGDVDEWFFTVPNTIMQLKPTSTNAPQARSEQGTDIVYHCADLSQRRRHPWRLTPPCRHGHQPWRLPRR